MEHPTTNQQQGNFDGMLARELFLRHQLKIDEARQRYRLLVKEQEAFESYPSTPEERDLFSIALHGLRVNIQQAEHDAIQHLRAIDTLYADFVNNATEVDEELSWNEALSGRHVPCLKDGMTEFIEAGRCPLSYEGGSTEPEVEDYPDNSRICIACYDNYAPQDNDPDLCSECVPLYPSPSQSQHASLLHSYMDSWRTGSSPLTSDPEWESSSDQANRSWSSYSPSPSSSDDEDDSDEQVALALRRSATAKLRAATARRTAPQLKTEPIAQQVATVHNAAHKLIEHSRDLATEYKRYSKAAAKDSEAQTLAQSDVHMDELMEVDEPLTPLPTPPTTSWTGEESSRYDVGSAGGKGKAVAWDGERLARALVEDKGEAGEDLEASHIGENKSLEALDNVDESGDS